jgi:hypothetical protein
MPRSLNRVTKTEIAFIIGSQLLVGLWTLWILNRPLQIERKHHIAEASIRLNGLAQEFWDQNRRWPVRNGGVWELAIEGMIDYKTEPREYHYLSHNFRWNNHTKQFTWREVKPAIDGDTLI